MSDQAIVEKLKDEFSAAVLEVAEKLGVPLLTHTGPLPQRPEPAGQPEQQRASTDRDDHGVWQVMPELLPQLPGEGGGASGAG